MALRLPRWEALSQDEQIPIINLPLNKTYVVTGGPGTGKTVMAVHRAARLKATKQRQTEQLVKFLVYNRPLQIYLQRALEETGLTEGANAQTWHTWFYNYYKQMTRATRVPETEPFHPDWDHIVPELLKCCQQSGNAPFAHLILDEAQDFPKPLLHILGKLCGTATIFADERQSIDEASSRIAEIMNAFEVGGNVRYYLTRNYRNTREILDASRLFYTGDDLPEHSHRRGDKPKLMRAGGVDDAVRFIANYADTYPEQNIGVLVADKDLRNSYYRELARAVTVAEVQKYVYRTSNFDFERDGIKILTYNTAKGLEFDAVFLPQVDGEFHKNPTEVKLNTLYMCCTRAKNLLFFLYSRPESQSFVLSRLTSTPGVVESEEIEFEGTDEDDDDLPF